MERERKPRRKLRTLNLGGPGPETPAARQRRLQELKRQVDEGTYEADPEKIARELLQEGLDEPG